MSHPSQNLTPPRSPHSPVDPGDVGGIPSTLDVGVEDNKTRPPVLPDPAQASARPAAPRGRTDEDDDDEDRYGDPATMKNEGVLESLGRAISSPVVESEPEPAGQRRR